MSDGTINNSYSEFNIKAGDNVTDAVAAQNLVGINAAITKASEMGLSTIKLQKGTYMIKVGANEINDKLSAYRVGLRLASNMTFDLNGSTIKMTSNYYPKYAVVLISHVHDSKLMNGTLVGDRSSHIWEIPSSYGDQINDDMNSHQYGAGVYIKDSQHIQLIDLKIHSCTGDGITLAGDKTTKKNVYDAGWSKINEIQNYDILIEGTKNNYTDEELAKNPQLKYEKNFQIYNCRRNGISIVYGDTIKIHNILIRRIKESRSYFDSDAQYEKYRYDQKIRNGKTIYSKESAIDIEPGNVEYTSSNGITEDKALIVKNVLIKDNIFYDTHSGNIRTTSYGWKVATYIKNVTVQNNLMTDFVWCAKDQDDVEIKYTDEVYSKDKTWMNSITKKKVGTDTYLFSRTTSNVYKNLDEKSPKLQLKGNKKITVSSGVITETGDTLNKLKTEYAASDRPD